MNVSSEAIRMIQRFEGFSSVQYDDGTGTMTIGYGTTSSDVSPLPHHLTKAQATELLRRKLKEKYLPAIERLHLPLNQNQVDALVSVTYNLGTGIVDPSHDLGRLLRQRNWHKAADSLMEYDRAGGRVLEGLRRRRAAERALFLRPVNPLHLLTPGERRLVIAFDESRRHKINRRKTERLRAALITERKLIWQAAQESGWASRHRRERYELLLERTTH